MKSLTKRLPLLASLLALAGYAPIDYASAAEPPAVLAEAKSPPALADGAAAEEDARFIRLSRDDNQRPLAMETAVVRYASAARAGITIDLVGAVHVGDQAYYDALNKLFEKYDVVLYELVAPEGTRVPKGGRKGPPTHPLGALQDGMSTVLELRHQLECVDYTRENFVHADMSPEEFGKTMSKRGESFMQMFLRLMGQGIAQSASGGSSDAAILMALFSKDRATTLKIAMAQQFEHLEGQLAVLDGPDGSTILTERNRKCFEVLEKQLQAGKKSIAIFYGAAHLPDMQRRLLADGFQRSSEDWLPAWQLQIATKGKAETGK
jgi:hypothetical protein